MGAEKGVVIGGRRLRCYVKQLELELELGLVEEEWVMGGTGAGYIYVLLLGNRCLHYMDSSEYTEFINCIRVFMIFYYFAFSV